MPAGSIASAQIQRCERVARWTAGAPAGRHGGLGPSAGGTLSAGSSGPNPHRVFPGNRSFRFGPGANVARTGATR